MAWKALRPLTRKELAPFRRARRARFFVDESLGAGTTEALRNHGINVKDVWEVGLWGRADETVFAYCRKHDRILLSHDTDFLNNRRFPIAGSPGVVILPGGSGDQRPLLRALADVAYYVWPFADWFHETKTVIGDDGLWRAEMFERATGKLRRTRYRFLRNAPLMVWE